MNKRQKEYWNFMPNLYESTLEEIQIKILRLKSIDISSEQFVNTMYFLSQDYRTLGILEFLLNKDYRLAKINFQKSSMLYYAIFLISENISNKVHPELISTRQHYKIFDTLISGDYNLSIQHTQMIAHNIENETKYSNSFLINAGCLIKSIILKEDALSITFEKELLKLSDKKMYRDVKSYVNALVSVHQKDKEKLNANIIKLIAEHKKTRFYFGMPDEFLSIQILGILKLAQINGIHLDIQDSICPIELLKDEVIQYPELDFLPTELKSLLVKKLQSN